MKKKFLLAATLLALAAGAGAGAGAHASEAVAAGAAAPSAIAPAAPSETAMRAAKHALDTYQDDVVDTLARLVSYDTVADPKLPCERNPRHAAFKAALKAEAVRLGLDFTDYGCVAVVGLGQAVENGQARPRLGLVAHGDVQPVDASKWKQSPFTLDRTSEPGRLLARGAEDDKGPIADALYALKSLEDLQLPLSKRIELYVYMAEESDWAPLEAFVKAHAMPEMNITLDAEYPAVVAEKGFGMLAVTLPRQAAPAPADAPWIRSFTGGFFAAQIPEDATAVVANANPALEAQLRQRAARQTALRTTFAWDGQDLKITAKGVSAHSSKPEDGVNAISMLADVLGGRTWPDTTAGALVNFLNEMVGTGYYGEKFGNIAYRDAFMGPMTFAPTVIHDRGDDPKLAPEQRGLELGINIRRPQGKTTQQLSNEINAALAQWQGAHLQLANVQTEIGEPWVQLDAPQLPTLLGVFSAFTGIKDPKPVAIGGGTNSRLFPHAVSFGPSMPHTVYTGHTEHEFIATRQLLLNLQMYTAVMAELAK
ncbi:dipeptidase [Massilia sp. 9096]|uniref:dipeptidase n=1 Tax=Massilia sp. 9096 TaxID=1500894 RepID=UPI00055E27CC|nr:dipeptidase [Massilia sp. 9096]